MATLTQIRTKANDKLTTLLPVLQSKQDAFFARKGRYFQVLWGTMPVDGADTAFTPRLRTNLDWMQGETVDWSDTIPFQLEVHEWNTGYILIVTILVSGTFYQRSRTNTNVDSDWFILENANDSRYGFN